MAETRDPSQEGDRLIIRAEAKIAAKDFMGALEDFRRALKLLPGDPRAEFGATMASMALREEFNAIMAATRRTENPGDVEAILNLADARRRNGKITEAIEVLEEAVAQAPEEARTHFELALTLSCWSKDHAAALPHFDRALALDPKFGRALSFRAISRRELGRYAEAVADLNVLQRLQPNDRTVYENRALALEGLGDHIGAELDYTWVLDRSRESWFYHTRRGFCRLAQERFAEAIADFDRALALRVEEGLRWYDPEDDPDGTGPDPNYYPEALLGRGLARIKRGEIEAARADLQAAVATFRCCGKEAEADEAEAMLEGLHD